MKVQLDANAVRQMIRAAIQKYTGILVENDDRHLMADDVAIALVDFLYVFRELEESLGFPVAKVLEKRDYTVFTINNLADAILEDMPNGKAVS